jgi:hypothetical protein
MLTFYARAGGTKVERVARNRIARLAIALKPMAPRGGYIFLPFSTHRARDGHVALPRVAAFLGMKPLALRGRAEGRGRWASLAAASNFLSLSSLLTRTHRYAPAAVSCMAFLAMA